MKRSGGSGPPSIHRPRPYDAQADYDEWMDRLRAMLRSEMERTGEIEEADVAAPSIQRARPKGLPTVAEIQRRHRIASQQWRENRDATLKHEGPREPLFQRRIAEDAERADKGLPPRKRKQITA